VAVEKLFSQKIANKIASGCPRIDFLESGGHFLSPKSSLLMAKKEFFNSHAIFHQLTSVINLSPITTGVVGGSMGVSIARQYAWKTFRDAISGSRPRTPCRTNVGGGSCTDLILIQEWQASNCAVLPIPIAFRKTFEHSDGQYAPLARCDGHTEDE
jgi:hypothetical protein